MRWEIEVANQSRTSARVYLLEANLSEHEVWRLASELLTDANVETAEVQPKLASNTLTVLPKPGVMDPIAESVQSAARDLGLEVPVVRTGRRYFYPPETAPKRVLELANRELANDIVEEVHVGKLPDSAWGPKSSEYTFNLVTVPLRNLTDEQLLKLSKDGQLALNLEEMRAVQRHFTLQQRDPTDVELETIAQTWSEHCSHKTLKGTIELEGPSGKVRYDNLLKETIFLATQEIRRKLGEADWCVSVFADNAGIVRFDDHHHVCFKVETHNHPSALEPYGGANTGLGGVIRDVLGTGLGGKPVCNTDVFCFAPPNLQEDRLPPGVLHPARVLRGVVAGVRDYGNRMGIPTVNGAICFDDRYVGNPLVFCGTVGLIPRGMEKKHVSAGDLIVAIGGRTGRDGIHGATFSSVELTHESESISGGAVQIGNAITEKKLLDVILQARDRRLYSAITDCGAGGFSSAIGEMGAEVGAEVHLERAPLKYTGLSYCEIWISEAQERMVLAVPPDCWQELRELCASEDVEATVLGEFKPTGRLKLYYQGNQVGDLEMSFLHEGRPAVIRRAVCRPCTEESPSATPVEPRIAGDSTELTPVLLELLSSWNICSKEWVIRQYDHEVQGGSVIKPLVGLTEDGPGDAAVISPILGSSRGVAIGCGINPRLGDLDPYWMAASAIDEAVRNVVAVGADPSRIALLDNFCWGNTARPETLGSIVRAAEACRDVALAFGMPFISGKDSLNNEFHANDTHIVIPPTLLISALGIVWDVRSCVTMDLKQPGDAIVLVGETGPELGGSHFNHLLRRGGGQPPRVNLEQAPRIFRAVHSAIQHGVVRACHDLSEGGLAVALAEMCFAGGCGASITLPASKLSTVEALFSEGNSRFLIEATQASLPLLERHLRDHGCPFAILGQSLQEPRLVIRSNQQVVIDADVTALKTAWKSPLELSLQRQRQ